MAVDPPQPPSQLPPQAPPPSAPAAPPSTPALRPGLRLSERVAFPPELPITASLVELANAIDAHQVVIVAGETGSGKTTQLPKLCLAMGRGARGYIGCTQPRRIAATSVAARVAQELQTELGDVVGYKVRFNDRIKRDAYIKFMTDGILLAELQGDALLRGYDTIIVDEAHERSLNIDFLLGVLKGILPRRPELRVIISSATLATERFSAFFGGAPVIEVSGRTYPVDVLYRPPRDDEADLVEAVANTVNEITELDPRPDVLVFLPGEREIRETVAELEQRALPHTVVLPLYAKLSAAEQQRVFQALPQRRVVLATNVAETSLTIPGIVYVVDTGVARVNRYNVRTGVTQLLVEPISQASANQRKGRCGRTQNGICFRLYDEPDFASRPAYTDPEIKRVGLAGVILRMKALRLGDVATFPFLDPPDRRAIDEGYRVLEELGALDDRGELTAIGQQLGRLPIDPRLGRMVLGGREEGALREVVVIAAALGLQDPRDRPLAAQQRADEAHKRFRDEGSDFAGYLKLWEFWQDARKRSSRRQLDKLCRDQFLSPRRMREWEDVHDQLVRVMRELDFRPNDRPASAEQIHRALLPGLLSKIGVWNPEARVYVGARQIRFLIHPSSALAKKPPPWIMAAELVQTSQLFARAVARIDPAWIERAAGPLCKRSHGDPHWEQKAAQVVAREQVTLYGLPIATRKIGYGEIDPARSRELFIEHALVRHEYTTKAPFQARNQALLDEVQRLRAKARRSDMLADEYALAAFFDARLPATVVSGATFETWRRAAEARDPHVLELALADVLLDETHELSPARYPDQLVVGGATLALSYKFEPSEDDDGATVTVPLAVLPQLDPAVMTWTVPGWHEAKIRALLEALPKATRKALGQGGSLDALAAAVAAALRPFDGPMLPALERAVHERTRERVPPDAWDLRAVPPHLAFTFRVVDEHDRVLGQDRDLAELQRALGDRARRLWAQAPRERHERTGLTAWDFDALPRSLEVTVGGRPVRAYPALVDAETAVNLRLLESAEAADEATRHGLRRLCMLQLRTTITKLEGQLPHAIATGPFAGAGAAVPPRRQLVLRALDEAFGLTATDAWPRSRAEFDARLARGRADLPGVLAVLGQAAVEVGAELHKARVALRTIAGKPGPLREAHDDLQGQLAHLAPPDVLATTPVERFDHLARYLRAIQIRLQRLPLDPQKDQQKAAQVVPLWQRFLARRDALRAQGRAARVEELGWMIEELRVQTFAPELKTAIPVSPRRVEDALAALAR
jgi:ATP-dependent helicase HrpA